MSDETEAAPRNSNFLTGHGETEVALRQDLAAGRLAHGIILGGPRGIGKATLAYRFARYLLAGGREAGPDDPVFRRVAAGSHSDLLVVEPPYDPKKDESGREISVEQARGVAQFLSLTPGECAWRVVIVDSADALNANAANAILKILEEPPPQAILLLVAHQPMRLLPTVRSRCRTVRLSSPDEETFRSIMRRIAPQAGDPEALGRLAGYSPGVALELHEQNAPAVYDQLLATLAGMPELDMAQAYALSEKLAGGKGHGGARLFAHLALHLLAQVARTGAGAGNARGREGEVVARLATLHPPAVWAARWQQAAEQFSLAERLHLDYKQVIIAFLHALATPEGLQLGSLA